MSRRSRAGPVATSADSSAVTAVRNPTDVFDGSRPVSLAAPRIVLLVG
jgi:hypothetical protein